MGQEGYLRMQQHFTIERLTDDFLAEYRAALDARGVPVSRQAGPRAGR